MLDFYFLLGKQPRAVRAHFQCAVAIFDQPAIIYIVDGALDPAQRRIVEADLAFISPPNQQRRLSRLKLTTGYKLNA